jgi:MazG nucleotide pyrophosphohydrolase domain.
MKEIIQLLRKFNEERDWEQFHDAKNLALALSIETAELNEAFLWKSANEANIEKIKEELADVFLYAFMMADKYNLDVQDICMQKIKKNSEKYPVEKAKGISKKYNEL